MRSIDDSADEHAPAEGAPAEQVAIGDVPGTGTDLSVTVVICAFSDQRWDDLVAAVGSLTAQTMPPAEIVVVIDHNEALLARARAELTAARVLPSTGVRGLSGARNTGVAAARGDVVLFLDDDAAAAPDWVEQLVACFADDDVIGVGGWVEARWDAPGRPTWFPEAFAWTVGCSYEGLPTARADIRNPIGAAMGFRRSAFDLVGGFSSDIGRVGSRPVGCEETEFAIRVRQAEPGKRIVLEPAARVTHHVTAERRRLRYFVRRCYHEGRSKQVVARLVGSKDTLSSERSYATRVLPRAVVRGLVETARTGRPDGAQRAGAVVLGLASTATGYAAGYGARPRSSSPSAAATAAASAAAPAPAPRRLPVWCTDLEISGTRPARLAAPSPEFRTAHVLVRLHGDPLGYVRVALTDGAAERHLAAEGVPAPATLEAGPLPAPTPRCPGVVEPDLDVTVAVCTRGRGEALRGCLRQLSALTYPRLDVLIVDNAPVDDATRRVFDDEVGTDPRFRYTVEPLPGLSHARNRALQEARGEVLAYTDDDVSVDPGWVTGLVRGFHHGPQVGCVTGLACTASIDGPAELYFDSRVSWGDSCEEQLYEPARVRTDPLFPYSPGIFGTGANFAFRTPLLRRLGGFDNALGAGTPSAGGEDLDIFVRVVQAGYTVAYEPSAIVWHHHRADLGGLRQQMFGYGAGLTAFLTKHLLDRRTRWEVLRRVPVGLARLVAIPATTVEALDDAPDAPRGLLRREFAGMLAGPSRYLRSRRELRRRATAPLTAPTAARGRRWPASR